MPSPFHRVQLATSKNKVERPEPITPVVESYAGNNNAWRGIQDHGVTPEYDPADPTTYTVDINGRHVPIKYEKPPVIDEPIPVRIVQDAGREFRTGYTDRITIGDRSVQVLGRDDTRIKASLLNTDSAKTVWIAFEQADLSLRGYPLLPGKELSVTVETDVWAISADGTNVTVGIYVEKSVPEKSRAK